MERGNDRSNPSDVNWFQKILAGPEPGPMPKHVRSPACFAPFPQGYDLQRWIADPNLAEQAQKLYSEGLFQNIMAVLYNGIPRGYPGRGIAVNDTMAHIELGRYQGYMDCLDLLNSLAVVSKPSTEVPLDWNAEQEP